MNWDFKSLSVLVLLNSLGAIIMNPYWGRLADRHGHKPVLTLCSLGLLLLPLFYIFCPWSMSWPIYLSNLLSGIFLSGFVLSMFSLTLAGLPADSRAMGSAVLAAAAGPAVFLAGALSGWAAEALSGLHWQIGMLDVGNYQLLFAASLVLRIPALLLLKGIQEMSEE